MLIFIDLGDNKSENDSFNPRKNFVLHVIGCVFYCIFFFAKYGFNQSKFIC